MHDLSQRLEAALAAANATLLSAHAHLCRAAAVRLAGRLPPGRTIALYCRAHDLAPVDARWIRLQALARMGAFERPPTSTVPARAGRIARMRLAVREWLRIQFAPHGDPALQELLAFIHAYARAVLLKIHVRNALRFAAALRPEFSGPAAVALYIERMDVPRTFSGAVYVLAVAQLGAARFEALLPAAGASAQPGRSTANSGAERATPAFGEPVAMNANSTRTVLPPTAYRTRQWRSANTTELYPPAATRSGAEIISPSRRYEEDLL